MKLLLGAVAVCAALLPFGSAAIAAPPTFQFGLTLGNPPAPPPPDYGDDCLPTKVIIGQLADDGYSRFRNFDDSEDQDYFVIDARRGSRLYRLTVDSCDGEILGRRRLYQ